MLLDDAMARWRNDPAFARVVQARDSLAQGRAVVEGLLPAPIRASWLRCMAAGLSQDAPRPVHVLGGEALQQRLAASKRLLDAADPELRRLERLFGPDGAVIGLADAEAINLRMLGAAPILKLVEQLNSTIGTCWPENEQGTNSIGTVLIERQPLTVRGGEHFFLHNTLFSCAAAPIIDVDGNVLGVIHHTVLMSHEQPDALGWVTTAARNIERRLFREACANGVTLELHGRPERLGSPWSGLALFDDGGVLRAINDEGASELGHPRTELVGLRFDELFDSDFAAWLAIARLDGRPLHTADGRGVHAAVDPWSRSGAPTRPGAWTVPAVNRALALESFAVGDPALPRHLEKAAQVFAGRLPVMIHGESGTGKEMLAHALHHGTDAASPFVTVNCAALPADLVNATLFGHVAGLGELREARAGALRDADGGTLFLNDVGQLPLATQALLLQVLQDRSMTPLGGSRAEPVAFRLITATHRDLHALVAARGFREDLFFRIHGYSIQLSALRERPQLAHAIQAVFERETAALGLTGIALEPALLRALVNYRWPGNLRELTLVARAALAALEPGHTVIEERHLAGLFGALLSHPAAPPAAPAAAGAGATLREAEHALIVETLQRCGGNVSATAAALGISRVSVYRKLKAAGIDHRRLGRG